MGKNIPTIDKEWRERVSFDFGKGGMAVPEGFDDLTVDDEVTVVVTGKISAIRQESDTASFSLQMEKIELQTGKKKGGLSEALAKSKKRQKL